MTSAMETNLSKAARGINLALGVWLFISAFVWDHSAAERTNTWIVGLLCVIFALVALGISTTRRFNTAVAIWLLISVWALPHHNPATMLNNALVAIAVLLLSLVPGEPEERVAEAHAPA
jgi:hypothetical protein